MTAQDCATWDGLDANDLDLYFDTLDEIEAEREDNDEA